MSATVARLALAPSTHTHVVEQDIVRLDVTVHDALRVKVDEPVEHLQRVDLDDGLVLDTAVLQKLCEASSLTVLLKDVDLRVGAKSVSVGHRLWARAHSPCHDEPQFRSTRRCSDVKACASASQYRPLPRSRRAHSHLHDIHLVLDLLVERRRVGNILKANLLDGHETSRVEIDSEVDLRKRSPVSVLLHGTLMPSPAHRAERPATDEATLLPANLNA